MEENNNAPESNVKSTIDAVTGLVQAIPIYQDTLQPAAKQIGQSLETVAKAVNIALSPVGALVWGFEQIKEFVSTRVTQKLKNTPKENIISPPPQVAGPALEALRYTGHEEDLRELYANLLATAMDKETTHNAHPAYVDIIKNITPDEARLLQAFINEARHPVIDVKAKHKESKGHNTVYVNYAHFHKTIQFQNPELTPSYLDNLCRLGLLEMPIGTKITDDTVYHPLENDKELDHIKNYVKTEMSREVHFTRKVVMLTSFGSQFLDHVVVDKHSKPNT